MQIKEFCQSNNLGNVIDIEKLTGGLMHKMFKVTTDKGVYAIKVLNPEVMSRQEALENFNISETISNLAKENGIPVSSALNLSGNFIVKYGKYYYMVFDYIDGKILKDDEITIEHCRLIGQILSRIHGLEYLHLGLDTEIKPDNFYVDWESYVKHESFNSMDYRDLYLNEYPKYYSLMKSIVEKFNRSNTKLALCHRDMDPKNVMWSNGQPIVIDWESAYLSNPYRELLEIALSWSGFLSNKFSSEKFSSVFEEYIKTRKINHVTWNLIIYGNLIGRFGWLDYNLKRSLGIKTNDSEEMKLAEIEVSKTIEEINRYLELVDTMNSIIYAIIQKEKQR